MAMVPWLDPGDIRFPPVEQALQDPDGLLAVGGDLQPRRLLQAYRQGIFPWYEEPHPILWWSPSVRALIQPGTLHVSRSLRRNLRRYPWQVTADRDFAAVIAGCAALDRQRPGTWITGEMRAAYQALHRLGWAHSIEVWLEGQLVGGLYGVAVGTVFFGESMFSHVSDASKVALAHLDRRLAAWGFRMLDCQMMTSHLAAMGARPVSRDTFVRQLRPLVEQPSPAADWSALLAPWHEPGPPGHAAHRSDWKEAGP